MRRANAAFLLAVFAVLAGLTTPAYAEGVLRAALLHSEPWSYYSNDSADTRTAPPRIEGIMPEISEALARETGLAFRNQLVPYARMWRDLKTGDCDLAYGIRSSDRDDYVRYAGYLFSFDTLVIARPGVRLKDYGDLRELRIGLLQDIRLSPKFDRDRQLNKHEFRDYETMVEMLLAGRLDAIAGNSVSLDYLLRKKRQSSQHWPRLVLQQSEVWAQLSRRSPHQADVEKIVAAIDKLRHRGYFEELLGRYGALAGPAD